MTDSKKDAGGATLFQYRYQQGPWQDAGEDYYNFCRKEREQGNLNFEVRALCECSTPVPRDGEVEIVDIEATFQRIDLLTARSAVTEAASAITNDITTSHSIANRFTEIMGAKIDAAKTHQRCDAVTAELRDALERMDAKFTSICNAYKGYLPDVETPDIRTRLMHIKDATKSFDAAHRTALASPPPSGAREALETIRHKMKRLKETECFRSGKLDESLLYGLHGAVERYLAALSQLPATDEAGEPFQHRQFLARARPKDRGPIPCMYPGCEATFKNEWACTQHRIAVHNEGTPISSAEGKTP